ncbi:FCD domain-containing protein [Vibrio sonorensis]|uniref:FCD domain-containing protein n=1 Tax=Vibrio sonorensis TaxID=1004316 RepID=UPI0009FE0C8C|nr:FCD domain-containing protein [Vibrio sonorensis]
MEHDTGFHHALLRLSGNQTLLELTQKLLDKSHRIRLLTLNARPIPEASTQEHTATYQALAKGDFPTAIEIHSSHRKRSSSELIELLNKITGLIETKDREASQPYGKRYLTT